MFIDLSDKKIVVVGGGNVAIDAARISSRCTDAKISMFCLEAREKNSRQATRKPKKHSKKESS